MAESRKNPSNLESPAWDAAAVTPGTALGGQARALYIGGEGNVEVVPLSGSTAVVFTAVPAGTILPIRTTLVDDNSTTATNIIALF